MSLRRECAARVRGTCAKMKCMQPQAMRTNSLVRSVEAS